MATIASRELRNSTRSLLDRVDAGETIVITVDGRAVAELRPVSRRPRTISKAEFLRVVVPNRADAGLSELLREIAPDTTDDLDLS